MSSRFLASLYSTLFATILAWPSGAVAGSFAYVSLDGENKIVVHAVNGSDGTLSRTSETELKAAPDRFVFRRIAGFFLRRCGLPASWLHFASHRTMAI